jgi:tRNA synthetases class II (A)
MNSLTKELFYENMYLSESKAKVLNCTKSQKGYEIILDSTIFYPMGGGQYGDQGYILDNLGKRVDISDTYLKNNYIVHLGNDFLDEGSEVKIFIDWELRYARMQEHSGEHIISGLVTKYFGYQNVGFHMGNDEITIDYNGVITKESLDKIEIEANKIIYENLPIEIYYPSEEELKNINYRSKKELSGIIRIVEIKGVDICACCGTHVKLTGEIGVIHFTNIINYKGGSRISLQIGINALRDYIKKDNILTDINQTLSSTNNEVGERVKDLVSKLDVAKFETLNYQKKYVELLFSNTYDEKIHFTKVNDIEPKIITSMIDSYVENTDIFVVVNERGSKKLCTIASRKIDLKQSLRKLAERGFLKGGGSSKMIQGELLSDSESLVEVIKNEV